MSGPSKAMTGARIGAIAGVIFLVALGGVVFNLLAPVQAAGGLVEASGAALLATVAVVVLGGLMVVATFALAGRTDRGRPRHPPEDAPPAPATSPSLIGHPC